MRQEKSQLLVPMTRAVFTVEDLDHPVVVTVDGEHPALAALAEELAKHDCPTADRRFGRHRIA